MASNRDEILEIIERCLEAIEQGSQDLPGCLEQYPDQRAELERLLPIALSLRQARSIGPSHQFNAAALDRLQQRLEKSTRPPKSGFVTNIPDLRSILRNWNPFGQRRVRRMPALVSILIAIVVLITGTVTGADAAGPGDLLYGVDRATEQVRLWLTTDEGSEAELQLEFAAERLQEAEIEIEAEGDPEAIDEALTAFGEALAALDPLWGNLTPEQQAQLAEMIAELQASLDQIEEIELSIAIEDGELKISIEAEFEGEHDDDEGEESGDGEHDDDDLEEQDLEDEHDDELEDLSECAFEHDDDDDDDASEHDDDDDGDDDDASEHDEDDDDCEPDHQDDDHRDDDDHDDDDDDHHEEEHDEHDEHDD